MPADFPNVVFLNPCRDFSSGWMRLPRNFWHAQFSRMLNFPSPDRVKNAKKTISLLIVCNSIVSYTRRRPYDVRLAKVPVMIIICLCLCLIVACIVDLMICKWQKIVDLQKRCLKIYKIIKLKKDLIAQKHGLCVQNK